MTIWALCLSYKLNEWIFNNLLYRRKVEYDIKILKGAEGMEMEVLFYGKRYKWRL